MFVGLCSKESINPDTKVKDILFEQKLKYPNGRKFVIAGGVVCEDGENPFDDICNDLVVKSAVSINVE